MKQQVLTRIYTYLMLTAFLLFTGFEGYKNIFDSKCVFFTASSLIYIVLSLVFKIDGKGIRIPQICAFAYLGITLLSAFASKHFPSTFTGVSRYEGLLTVGIYVLVFVFVSCAWKRDGWFVPLLSAVMLVQSVIVIVQLLGYNILWLYPKGTDYYIALERYNGAFISTVGNADIASALFSLMTPILWVLFFGYKKHRALTLVSAILSLFCLLSLSVTAGVVAIAVTAFILPIVVFTNHRKRILVAMAVLVALLVILILIIPFKEGTLYELQAVLKGNADSDFGSGRLHIWGETLKNIKPLLGTGPDTMLLEGIEPFTKTVNGKTVTRHIDIAHNDYLNILFHQGVFAFIAYMGMLAALAVKWYKNGRSNIVATAVGAGVFAYCVQVFFSFSACSSAIFFWIMLGILSSELNKSE